MELEKAQLCCNCDFIFEGRMCPRCTSKIFIFLRNITGSIRKDMLCAPKLAKSAEGRLSNLLVAVVAIAARV